MASTVKVNPLKRLWDLIRLDKKDVWTIYFYAVLTGLIQLTLPVGVQTIIGFVMGATMVTSIYILIFIVVLGVLIVGLMQINQMKIIEKIQQKIFARYAYAFAEAIPRIDLRKADDYYLPEKVNYFFDTLTLQKGISKILLDIPTASIQIIFGLILLSLYHPIFIAFGFFLIGILWIIMFFSSKRGWTTSLIESKYKYEVVAWLEEMARVIRSFKFSQGTNLNQLKNTENVSHYLHARTTHFKVLLLQYNTLVVFKVLITTAMLTVGTYLLLNQTLNIGEFIAAELVILSIIGAVEKFIYSLDNVYDVITSLEKVSNVLEIPAERSGTLPFGEKSNGTSIQVVNMSFEYPNQKLALNNINFEVAANSKIAISGNESSGKTSLLRVLSGNFSDFSGSVLLNGVPIKNYDLRALRAKIGVFINQQDIFRGSVIENITLNRSSVSIKDIMELATKLGIQTFINSFKNGFDTELEPAGKKLSSSLIRKILLLRAFVNKPQLLLLEEPWLGLEEEEKNKLQTYILRELPQTTLVVISNDEVFNAQCTQTIFMENGQATTNQTK